MTAYYIIICFTAGADKIIRTIMILGAHNYLDVIV